MSQHNHQRSLLNRSARVLLCLVFIHAVIGKLTGFAGVAGTIAAKGLPLAPLLLVADQKLRKGRFPRTWKVSEAPFCAAPGNRGSTL